MRRNPGLPVGKPCASLEARVWSRPRNGYGDPGRGLPASGQLLLKVPVWGAGRCVLPTPCVAVAAVGLVPWSGEPSDMGPGAPRVFAAPRSLQRVC